MNRQLASMLLALAAVSAAPSAQAISLFGVQTGGNVVSTALTTDRELAVDIGFLADAPVQVRFTVQAEDLAAGATFSSIIDELRLGQTLQDVRLTLDQGARFQAAGAVLSLAWEAVALAGALPGGDVTLLARAASTTEVTVGDPLFLGAAPWSLDLAGVSPGQVVTLTVSQVPEPASWVLALAGMGLLGLRRRR